MTFSLYFCQWHLFATHTKRFIGLNKDNITCEFYEIVLFDIWKYRNFEIYRYLMVAQIFTFIANCSVCRRFKIPTYVNNFFNNTKKFIWNAYNQNHKRLKRSKWPAIYIINKMKKVPQDLNTALNWTKYVQIFHTWIESIMKNRLM